MRRIVMAVLVQLALSSVAAARPAEPRPVVVWTRAGAAGAESLTIDPGGTVVRHARGQEFRTQLAGVQLLQFRRWVLPAARDTIDWGNASVGRAVLTGAGTRHERLPAIRKRAIREWLESLLTYTPDDPLAAVRHNAVVSWYRESVPSSDTLIVSRSGAALWSSRSSLVQMVGGLPEPEEDGDSESEREHEAEASGQSTLRTRAMPRQDRVAQPLSDDDLAFLYWVHDTFGAASLPLVHAAHASARLDVHGTGTRPPTPEERDRIWAWMTRLEKELR